MNRPLEEILVEILRETGCSPVLNAVNLRSAASPHIRTEQDCWQWKCEVWVKADTQGGGHRLIGDGPDPARAAMCCYHLVLAADRSDWKH